MHFHTSFSNKCGICIPNSTTEVWTVDDVDLFNFVKVQRDQHVSSSDTLHQDQNFKCSTCLIRMTFVCV